MSIGAYKDYHLLEIGTKVYLVFSSRRAGDSQDIIMKIKFFILVNLLNLSLENMKLISS